jgi:cobalamin biosynthesis Mg chelatase CobN
MRTLIRMRKPLATGAGVAAIALVALLLAAPAAFAVSAVDQYSESIPTAGGQKPTRDLGHGSGSAQGGGSAATQAGGGSAGTATVPAQTRSQLQRTKNGLAAERAARLTAPTRPSASSTDTSSSGMGFLLPLILAASLAVAVAVFLARRRTGPAGGPAD